MQTHKLQADKEVDAAVDVLVESALSHYDPDGHSGGELNAGDSAIAMSSSSSSAAAVAAASASAVPLSSDSGDSAIATQVPYKNYAHAGPEVCRAVFDAVSAVQLDLGRHPHAPPHLSVWKRGLPPASVHDFITKGAENPWIQQLGMGVLDLHCWQHADWEPDSKVRTSTTRRDVYECVFVCVCVVYAVTHHVTRS